MIFLVWAVLIVAFFSLGAILRHHWQKYAPDKLQGRLLQILYWMIGSILLTTMAITYFTSSL
ncbi:MAG: hypothetical protein AAB972_03220 [Patescibacteria group bacterium]